MHATANRDWKEKLLGPVRKGVRGSFKIVALLSRYRGRGLKRVVRQAIVQERRSTFSLPVGKRVRAWRLGFKSSSYVLYDLDANDPADYLPDVVMHHTHRLDEPFGRVLRDKLLLNAVLGAYVAVPEVLAIVGKGRIFALRASHHVQNVRSLLAYCEANGGVILKPCQGNKGRGVASVEVKGAGIYLNGKRASLEDVERHVAKLNNYLVTGRVVQARYAAEIFPQSTNTLRVITMQDPANGHEPFIPVATHRFGVQASIPTDNWAKGGLDAKIDLDTGGLSPARRNPLISREWYHQHPDTGAQIAGVRVRNWDQVKSGLLNLVEKLSFFKYVGWDVVVTEEGFTVIEGNNPPDIVIQKEHPFLADPRAKRFFEHHRVI